MFSIFKKDPTKKLEQEYRKKLEQAMQAQRNGDIKTYSRISEEADSLYKEIQNKDRE